MYINRKPQRLTDFTYWKKLINMLYLNLLVTTIMEMYFQDSRCVLIFSENFNRFEYKGDLPVVTFNVVNTTIDESIVFRDYGCQKIIIQHKNASAILTRFEEKMKLYKVRFNFRKYLIVPNLGESENLTKMFDLPALEYINNILILVPETPDKDLSKNEAKFSVLHEEQGRFKLMTNRYVGQNYNSVPEVLDFWFSKNQSFLYGTNLYPDKISNQQGRILRCATFNYAPYSIIEQSEDVAKGSENCIAHEYAKQHNMTLKYVTDDDEWGIIYENWTGNGILGNIATDKADMGYGALYTWEHEYGFLDFSKPVVRTGITCLVPAPVLAAGWLTPFLPFSLPMWIGTGLSYLVASLVTVNLTAIISKEQLNTSPRVKQKKISYRKISKETFLSIFRIFLIQSLPSPSKELGKALRHIFMVFLFSLLMTASYSSGLASVMTIPRYKDAILTVWDLANSGLNWGATQDAWIFSLLSEKRPPYVELVDRFIATSQENLIRLAKTDHFAFSIERLPSGHYAIGPYITVDVVKKLRLMHEDLYWEYCIFMLRKSSPLLNSLNALVLRLVEGGLINFWEMKTAETHMNLPVQNIVKYYRLTIKEKQEDEIIKLKWMHVEGTFGILVIGCGIASLCFVTELLIYKQKYRYKFIH